MDRQNLGNMEDMGAKGNHISLRLEIVVFNNFSFVPLSQHFFFFMLHAAPGFLPQRHICLCVICVGNLTSSLCYLLLLRGLMTGIFASFLFLFVSVLLLIQRCCLFDLFSDSHACRQQIHLFKYLLSSVMLQGGD